jgi:hypothetical protein
VVALALVSVRLKSPPMLLPVSLRVGPALTVTLSLPVRAPSVLLSVPVVVLLPVSWLVPVLVSVEGRSRRRCWRLPG